MDSLILDHRGFPVVCGRARPRIVFVVETHGVSFTTYITFRHLITTISSELRNLSRRVLSFPSVFVSKLELLSDAKPCCRVRIFQMTEFSAVIAAGIFERHNSSGVVVQRLCLFLLLIPEVVVNILCRHSVRLWPSFD